MSYHCNFVVVRVFEALHAECHQYHIWVAINKFVVLSFNSQNLMRMNEGIECYTRGQSDAY